MNAPVKIEEPSSGRDDALARLREPFPDHQISKLPKESRKQSDERKADRTKIVWKCEVCGGTHHKDAVHLDYVGHAAATDRLLDADPRWNWEPVPDPASLGLPVMPGGMWIKLTVDGVSRYGFGCAEGKTGGDAIKEVIGDAIRNAGMRFGMALGLWHKGDLHGGFNNMSDAEIVNEPVEAKREPAQQKQETITEAQWTKLTGLLEVTRSDVKKFCEVYRCKSVREISPAAYDRAVSRLEQKLAKMTPAKPEPVNAEFEEISDEDLPY